MFYVHFHPDRNKWFISYPYYAKYTKQGENPFFRHIGININQAITNKRGVNAIQGTLSLDDETRTTVLRSYLACGGAVARYAV
ncbi:hypothetical protein PHISCL_09321 [Aspergillus sclerotialis]|uniref:Uncharacterized protein n=1 Tax=Aspergillus sclerotialis TaxID=2070753 RepID=A0A3A2Z5H7_9EURO|nr:hypothetical protein PHISCL_09321 [Aspergillus sclerotialis]